jgi:hypothetical protein
MLKFRPCHAVRTASIKTAFGYGCSAKLMMCGYCNAQTVPSILSANFSHLSHHRIWRQRPTSGRTISSRVIPASNPDEILRNTFDSYATKILADPSRLQHNIKARGLKISIDELVIIPKSYFQLLIVNVTVS